MRHPGSNPFQSYGIPSLPERGARGENSQRLRPQTSAQTNKSVFLEPALSKIQFKFVDVTPAPVFSGLKRSHDGMRGRMEVFRSMLIFRRIATTDVPAAQAQAKVYPPITRLQTLFTTSGMRFDVLDLIEMRTASHCFSPMGCCRGSRT